MSDIVKVPYGSENQWSPVPDPSSSTPVSPTTPDTSPIAAASTLAPTGIVKVPYGSENRWSEEPTITPSGNGFGTGGAHTTDAQAAANRTSLANYGQGLKEGAGKFGQMITSGGDLSTSIPNAIGYLGDAIISNTPLTSQFGAARNVAKDIFEGVSPPSQDRLDSHDLTFNQGGLSNFGNDKYGNPIFPGQDYTKNLQDINQSRINEANQTSPQFYNTTGAIGSSLLPMGLIGKTANAAKISDRLIGSTVTGGLYGGAQGASDTPDWGGNPIDLIKNTLAGVGIGAGLGVAIPTISSALGGGYNKLADSILPTKVADTLPSTRDALISSIKGPESDAILQQRLRQLGPEGTFADVTPAASSFTRGTATEGAGTEAQNTIYKNLEARAAGMPARVSSDVDTALGPLTDTQRGIARDLTDKTKDIGENELLPSVRAAGPIDAKPLVDYIDQRLPVAVGPEKAALQNIRNDLVTPGKPPVVTPPTPSPGGSFTVRTPTVPAVPTSTMVPAEKLNEIRKKISDMTTWGAPDIDIPSGAQVRKIGSLKYLGGQTRQMLGDNVPGFNEAMTKISPLMEQREALNYGVDSLHDQSSGADFAHDFSQYSPQAQDAVKLGMRYGIDSQLGNTKNDAVGLRNLLQNQIPPPRTITPDASMPALPGQGYNSQKIETAFGPAARSQLDNTVNREGTFANTHAEAVLGSRTDINTAARNLAEKTVPENKPLIPGKFSDLTGAGIGAAPIIGAINKTAAAYASKINPMDYHVPAANALVGNKGLDAQNILAQALRAQSNLTTNKNVSNHLRAVLNYGMGSATIPSATYIGKNNQ